MNNIVVILLIFLLLGAFGTAPTWGWHNAGYWPSGGLGLIFVVLIILALLGKI